MQPDGQIYADFDGSAPPKDIERYNKAHAAAYALEVYKERELLARLRVSQEQEAHDAEAR